MASSHQHRIGSKALLVSYAMSRLDRRSLQILGCRTWDEAFEKAGRLLGENPMSIKALRDEFDPYFDNSRRGWFDRPMRPPLVIVMHEMASVSQSALEAMLSDTVEGRSAATDAVEEILGTPPNRVANVAERLRTGRIAETYFLQHCQDLLGFPPTSLEDMRYEACGYDFFAEPLDKVIEVKGLVTQRGQILFTDLEWQTALRRKESYLLVVVSQIETKAEANLLLNPARHLAGQARSQRSLSVSWTATFPPTPVA